MKKVKENLPNSNNQTPRSIKGITLVALVVTIVILIILAGVTLNIVIDENGIIAKAREGTSKWKQAQEHEQGVIEDYYGIIDDITSEEENLPIFVDSIEQCTDVKKKYVLPDGYLYEYKATRVPNFNNLVDTTSEDWLNDTRLSTSATSALTGVITTNYISCGINDVIRVKGLNVLSTSVASYPKTRYHLLNSSKQLVVADCGYLTHIQADGKVNVDGDITTIIAGYTKADQTTLREWTSTEFIRLCGELINGYAAEDVIITVNEEISYLTDSEYSWQKTSKYIPEDWHSEVKTVASTVSSLKNSSDSKSAQFLLTSDIHYYDQSNIQNIGKISAEIMRVCDIPFFMNLGDNTPDGFNTSETPDYAFYMNKVIDVLAPINTKKILATVGNHDGTSGLVKVNNEIVHYGYDLSNQDRVEVYFGWQKSNPNKKFGPDGSYYYIDDSKTKTRYIMLNSFWNEWEADDNGCVTDIQHSYIYTPMFGQEQITWFVNEALNMDEGYTAIIGTHGATPDYGPSKDLQVFKDIISAYVEKSSFTCEFNGEVDWQSYSISGNFSNTKGELVAIFHGHEHKDAIDTDTYAVPFIGITSASNGARDTNAPTRTVGTNTETAIDIVTVNKENRTIYLTRLGVGEDRYINY